MCCLPAGNNSIKNKSIKNCKCGEINVLNAELAIYIQYAIAGGIVQVPVLLLKCSVNTWKQKSEAKKWKTNRSCAIYTHRVPTEKASCCLSASLMFACPLFRESYYFWKPDLFMHCKITPWVDQNKAFTGDCNRSHFFYYICRSWRLSLPIK